MEIDEENIEIAEEFEEDGGYDGGERILQPFDCRVIEFNPTSSTGMTLSVFHRM